MAVAPEGWRLVTPAVQTVPAAVALSARLLTDGECPALVVHRVHPPAITCGRAQLPGVDPATARDAGLEVVARPSGGGPVLWDDDLIAIDVVLPAGHPLLPADVVAAYRWVGDGVAAGLRMLGVTGARAVPPNEARSRTKGPAAGLCFGGLSPWEVVSGDRKVLGLSQVRRRAGAIIQVGVPMRLDAERLARAVSAPPAAAADLLAHAAGISDLVPGTDRAVAEDALVRALLGAVTAGSE